jgi:hypothetical protein
MIYRNTKTLDTDCISVIQLFQRGFMSNILPKEAQIQVIAALVEGFSTPSIERVTGIPPAISPGAVVRVAIVQELRSAETA